MKGMHIATVLGLNPKTSILLKCVIPNGGDLMMFKYAHYSIAINTAVKTANILLIKQIENR